MKHILPALGIVLVAGLTLVAGIIHGRMSNRWGATPDTLAAAERLMDLPEQFGAWQLQSSEIMSDTATDMLECAGHISRTYVNQQTNESVSLMILLGPSGPISVHTPEICYPSRAYKTKDERRRVAIKEPDGSDHQFWALTFQPSNFGANVLRVYYAWSTGGCWSAPAEPRFTLAEHTYIYKIQLSSDLPPGTDFEAGDPCRRFLQDFVPTAKGYLIEPAGN